VHAGIVVALTLLTIYAAGGWRWVRHFAFPVAFILISVPWITAVEVPIVQGLMRVVAIVATEALHLFGIPAQLEGSLIRIRFTIAVAAIHRSSQGVIMGFP